MGPAERPGMLGGPVPEATGGLATFSSPSTPAGRLHHQAGDLHPGAPEDHRGRGPGHCLCTGVCVWGGAGHHPCTVCVGGWASPMCRCVVGAVPRPCAVCCGGCASPVCRCVGGAGYRQCTDVVCMGGWASPVCRFVGGWASPVCHVCCGPGLTCSCWPCAQVFGMLFTCCLYKSLKLEHY